MRLDHLSYAAGPEGLAACVQRLGARLGAGFSDGGIHPSFGTRNFVLPLAGGCYLEVVEALDHPAVDRAPFGRAVRDRTADGGGWLAWVIGVDDIAPIEHRLSRIAAAGHRRRPDGVDLRWAQIGVNDVAADPQLPFFVQWHVPASEHPSSRRVARAPAAARDRRRRADGRATTSARRPSSRWTASRSTGSIRPTTAPASSPPCSTRASGPVRID